MSKILKKIISYDAKGEKNEYLKKIKQEGPFNFIIFSCSTINSQYLWSKTPWLYVSTNPKGNNLEADLPKLNKIMASLRKINPQAKLTILIGNTDPYYIYLQQFKNINKERRDEVWQKFIKRWQIYRNNLEKWINARFPDLQPKVVSWYQFEKKIEKKKNISFEKEFDRVREKITDYFSQRLLKWEKLRIEKQFGPDKYFSKLTKPDDLILEDWIKRKFTEYAVQGKWIYQYFPESILIQNEKPSDLRSSMYQPLIQERFQDQLPIVYFFGLDNAGYQ